MDESFRVRDPNAGPKILLAIDELLRNLNREKENEDTHDIPVTSLHTTFTLVCHVFKAIGFSAISHTKHTIPAELQSPKSDDYR